MDESEAEFPKTIETSRLLLRPPEMTDAPAIFEQYGQDPKVTKYVIWRPHKSITETEEFLRRSRAKMAEGNAGVWVILQKATAQLMGMVEARREGHKLNLGYVLARAYWGRGYTSEAVEPIVRWGLAQPQIFRVWAVCDTENVGSSRVLEKVGMQREGILRRWMIHPNIAPEPRDSYCYAITK